ncbi:uncharacterized protein LOC125045520 isoform X1 [Penaeus chinensis]|uniref:uncharacterized protein LOC125045520 isoform X1 n=1 Tax=Penaeus chinensis TaxID=139456 RepID=UPI001FB5AC55|nr:uncharacterized protein LOC125045520 isoform X1 [Penaeus chinensis]
MAAFQTGDIAAFQTIEVSSDENGAFVLAAEEDDRREDTEFNNDATILLIKFIRRRYNELQYQRTRPQVYRDVYEELCKNGYNFSVERIRRKWNNLLGSYKRVKKLKKTRKLQWEYYQILNDFLPPEFGEEGTDSYSRYMPESPNYTIRDSYTPSSSSQNFPSSVTVHVPPPSVGKEIERGTKRQAMMEQYVQQLKERDFNEEAYKKRKEKRERMKVRALRKISKELQNIAKTQCEILSKQEQILMYIDNKDV